MYLLFVLGALLATYPIFLTGMTLKPRLITIAIGVAIIYFTYPYVHNSGRDSSFCDNACMQQDR